MKEPEQQEAEIKVEKEEKQDEKDEKEYKTIGTESEDAYKLLLKNHTGGEITYLEIKVSSAPEFPENMMAADMKIPVQETVRVYYAAPESVDQMNAEAQLVEQYQYEQSYYEEPVYQPDYSQSAPQDTSGGQGSDVGQSGEGRLDGPVFRY